MKATNYHASEKYYYLKYLSILSIKQLCLRGTTLKNTEYVFGITVYTGFSTKLMKNAKHPRSKMSKVLKKMNRILVSV